ncbi:MAG: histidine kinase [Leeuwenhoekiella sp.]
MGKKILLHGVFWLAVLLFYTFFFGQEKTTFKTVFQFSCFLLPVTIAVTYVFIYFLIPEHLLKKKYIWFAVYTLYTLIFSSTFIIFSSFYGVVFLSGMPWETFPIKKSILFIIIAVYLVVAVACGFSLLKHNYQTLGEKKALENEILNTQLQLREQQLNQLKMQIHPHFLFNTLNTIYGFALTKNEHTPELILNLSKLLDYILYQTNKPLVSLKEEIDHIQDYIALEEFRFNKNLSKSIQFKNQEEYQQVFIAPMLLLPFVENSFKHGKSENGKLVIEMLLEVTAGEIHFHLKNTKNSEISAVKSPTGLGLKNIKQRLDILYKTGYTLEIKDKPDYFVVDLYLNSTEHRLNEREN